MVKFNISRVNARTSARSYTYARWLGMVALALAHSSAWAQIVAETVELPEFEVKSRRVAIQEAFASLDMPVSALRFEPKVDVQGRNLAEAQADIAIRGGIFENTGFRLGALPLGDPQTGHYVAEIPVPPAMLQQVEVLTGADNAARGFNANAGTLAFSWAPIRAGGRVSVGVGDHGLNHQSVYLAAKRELGARLAMGIDVDLSRSESDGTVPFGDHEFERGALRGQLAGPGGQTDFFAGYQSKFFGWPKLYAAPFVSNESENLQTVLLAANHTWRGANGNELEVGAFYRRNKDEYKFNRASTAPTPFLHTTWLQGGSVSGRTELASTAFALRYAATFIEDDLTSRSLTFGRYMSRSLLRFALIPEWEIVPSGRDREILNLRAGATYDYSRRNGGAISPLVSARWQRADWEYRAEYSETTQLPTYTALNSNPNGGLFRGNPNLGRTRSRNAEIGLMRRAGTWFAEATLFHRRDDDLVDWTFQRGVVGAARNANAVDIATTGAELLLARRTEALDLAVGYTWLAKSSDYGNLAGVDASFYALNFPKHRLTFALTWRFGRGWEIRSDNEVRVQEDNWLRDRGGDEAALSSIGVYYRPPALRGWEFSAHAENLWGDNFQEVPGVPAAGRQLSLGVVRRW